MDFTIDQNLLIRTKDANLNENFIALGMSLGSIDGVQQGGHSALFLCFNKELFIFHFNHGKVIFDLASNDPFYEIYYHRPLDFFTYSDSEMHHYISTFKAIQSRSNLKYGFIFDGSFYDPISGAHISNSGLPELSTCVGFCINVLSGMIIEVDKYVEFEDWGNDFEHPRFRDFFEHAKTYFPSVNEDEYKNHHRRISPNECTLTGYFDIEDLPIRKAHLDELKADYESMIGKLSVA